MMKIHAVIVLVVSQAPYVHELLQNFLQQLLFANQNSRRRASSSFTNLMRMTASAIHNNFSIRYQKEVANQI
jgi:hypothetical protein